jgi:RNA polymerase sigma-70 factor (ECF subfamily)
MEMDEAFRDLMQRVRAGDQTAALELHASFAEQLHRIIRVRLTQSSLRRRFDSLDVCQSVMADFFVRTALGQYDLQSPTELMKLLATMARNRLYNHSQREKAARRDTRRTEGGPIEELAIPGSDATPSLIVATKEILACAHERLTEEEQMLIRRRRNGETWNEIAAATGRSAEAVRKQYERALDRVSAELGISEPKQ